MPPPYGFCGFISKKVAKFLALGENNMFKELKRSLARLVAKLMVRSPGEGRPEDCLSRLFKGAKLQGRKPSGVCSNI